MNFYETWTKQGPPATYASFDIVWVGKAHFIARAVVANIDPALALTDISKMDDVPHDITADNLKIGHIYHALRKSDGTPVTATEGVKYLQHALEAVSLYEPRAESQPSKAPNHTLVRRLGQHIPDFYAVTKCPGAECTNSTGVYQMVQHLNDLHRWKRERIADWLETLDLDLTVHQEEVRPASDGTGEGASAMLAQMQKAMAGVSLDEAKYFEGGIVDLDKVGHAKHNPDGSITLTTSLDYIDPNMVKVITGGTVSGMSIGFDSAFDKQMNDEMVKNLSAALDPPKPILMGPKGEIEPPDWSKVTEQIKALQAATKHMVKAVSEAAPKIKDFLDSLPAELIEAAEAKIQENKKEEKDEH